ncbi:hypothetical protein ABPG74_018265 [Tetrahymena malaccensis]
MKLTLLLLGLFLGLSSAIMIPHPGPLHFHNPPRYQVDIDAPPKVQWAPVMNDFKEPLSIFIAEFENLLPIPKWIFNVVGVYGKAIFKYQKYVKQIEAIAELTDLPFNTLFTLNFMYELASWKACTGVVVRNNKGTIYHGRNLDFEFFRYFANLTMTIDYYRNNQHIFSVDGIAGAIFFHSGVKPGKFGLTQTTRNSKSLFTNLEAIAKGNFPSVWLIKETLETEDNFDDAVKKLNTTAIACPIYYMVSGPGINDGVVIERNYDSIHGFYQLNETTSFLVQTNYDRDIPDPWYDRRRIPAQERLEKLNGNINETVLMEDIMMKYPTLNIATIMSTVVNPRTGYFNTSTWW